MPKINNTEWYFCDVCGADTRNPSKFCNKCEREFREHVAKPQDDGEGQMIVDDFDRDDAVLMEVENAILDELE